MSIENCSVAYSWALPAGLPDAIGTEAHGRRVVVSPRILRVEHWPAHDSPGALHVFIDGIRVRADGSLGTHKGLGYSDEPEQWSQRVRHTDEPSEWIRAYLDREDGRGGR